MSTVYSFSKATAYSGCIYFLGLIPSRPFIACEMLIFMGSSDTEKECVAASCHFVVIPCLPALPPKCSVFSFVCRMYTFSGLLESMYSQSMQCLRWGKSLYT